MSRSGAGVRLALAVLVAGTAVPRSAPAADYRLQPEGSRLEFSAIQQGAAFDSHFERFTAEVAFDPARPGAGRITARIDLGSVDTGNPERDEVLLGADWFHRARWPEAVFRADRIASDGAGYAAAGTLTLRDVTAPVTLRFRWSPATGDRPARLTGTASLDRLTFGVGQGEWRDTSYVGNRVEVRVDVALEPTSVKSVTIDGGAMDGR